MNPVTRLSRRGGSASVGWRRAAGLALGLVATALAGGAATLAELGENFDRPPVSARTWVWWHWMNGHVSETGITRDLEALARAGVGGVVLFEEGNRVPAGPVRYLSGEHWRLIGHAVRECRRLGLGFDFHNCPGWSASGGPWITPENAMKHLTWSETTVTGGGRVTVRLPRPPTVVEPYRHLPHPGRYQYHDFYRDVTVLAFPTPAEPGWRLPDWEKKAGFLSGYNLGEHTGEVPPGAAVARDAIRVPEGGLDGDGTLHWDAPPGDWTIVRFGYTLTGHVNRAAPTTGAVGLECDKLSRAGVDAHWEGFVAKVLEVADAAGARPVNSILLDSYETLTQTWTPLMPAEFRRLRGYDLTRFLPALMGRVVDDVRATEKFLWDYRRTLADLVAEHYFGYFGEKCRERGILLSGEGYGLYGTFFDDFAVNARLDIPMGEFWSNQFKWHHWTGKVAASAADLTGRHVVGAEAYTAGGANAAWRLHPFLLKAQGDYFYCRGINRYYIQASVHQPWPDAIRPGMTFGLHGMQMHRNNTWWPQAHAWLAYQSRCQYLLQHGRLVTDALVYLGENAPSTFWPNAGIVESGSSGSDWDPDTDTSPDFWLPLAPGRDFHVGNADIVRQLTVAPDGRIVLPGGQGYHALVLPADRRMRPDIVARLEELAAGGALIIGPRPDRAPSLQDGPEADERVRVGAARLWGSGKVHEAGPLEALLAARGVAPDFEFRARAGQGLPPAKIDYLHRRVDDGEFYFVSNQRSEAASVECVFRVAAGVAAEWWQPETGERRPILQMRRQPDGRLAIPLEFGPAESGFVVFRTGSGGPRVVEEFLRDGRPVAASAEARLAVVDQRLGVVAYRVGEYAAVAQGTARAVRVGSLPPVRDLSSDWTLEFPGADARRMVGLHSWTNFTDDEARHHSGTATYRREFTLDAAALGAGIVAELDLGSVREIAELEVNGVDLGVLWTPPFRREVTAALRPGVNSLVVRVTNLWRNRLIGDARLRGFGPEDSKRLLGAPFLELPDWVPAGGRDPDSRVRTFSLNPFLNSSHEPDPSGLLGPVRLIWGRTTFFP